MCLAGRSNLAGPCRGSQDAGANPGARVVELVDTATCPVAGREAVRVRIPPWAHQPWVDSAIPPSVPLGYWTGCTVVPPPLRGRGRSPRPRCVLILCRAPSLPTPARRVQLMGMAAPVYYTADMVLASGRRLSLRGRARGVAGDTRSPGAPPAHRAAPSPGAGELPRRQPGRRGLRLPGRHLLGARHPRPAGRLRRDARGGKHRRLGPGPHPAARDRSAESLHGPAGSVHQAPPLPGGGRTTTLAGGRRCAARRSLDARRHLAGRRARCLRWHPAGASEPLRVPVEGLFRPV